MHVRDNTISTNVANSCSYVAISLYTVLLLLRMFFTGLKKAKNMLDLAYIYVYNHAPHMHAYI